ncbi:hypothetical protein EDD21DRAFT_46414 [Dissophora ornata]|nr:hypothetical protein EDD21DRAFT_46414 [Dissophora ornata]
MSSDTTPLLSGHTPRRVSIPSSRSAAPSFPSSYDHNGQPASSSIVSPSNNPNISNPNNNNNNRHWSEETEDISSSSSSGGPDPNSYGHPNTGTGYRRRGLPLPSPIHYSSDLDAQRFSGQDRPTGLRRLLCGCCCLPCRTVWFHFKNRYSKLERYLMAMTGFSLLLAIVFLYAYVRAMEAMPDGSKNVSQFFFERVLGAKREGGVGERKNK